MNYENQSNRMDADNTATLHVLKTLLKSALQIEPGEEGLENNQS